MLSRRILRIKVIQALYAYFKSNNDSISKAEKELFYSIEKTVELYHFLLLFIVELVKYGDSRIELGKQKKMPTYDDLHPNTKFINNLVVEHLLDSESFKNFIDTRKVNWVQFPEIVKKFYQYMVESELYQGYILTPDNTTDEDVDFFTALFADALINYEDLYNALEDKSIYWNDDIDFIISIIKKDLKRMREPGRQENGVIVSFKNQDDIDFTKNLFRKSVVNYSENVKLIQSYSENWDIDRIAFMDILIMNTAITEIMEFSSIPVKVSFDEYLEISKRYSTSNSSVFINGILDKIVRKLKEEKKIIKRGKGLIGEK